MKIVADENIPLLAQLFGAMGEVVALPGSHIRPNVIRDADALIVRSVTRIDESLLAGSSVRFVGTATAGTDHVDLAWLTSHDITFSYAPGSNADSVVDYVIAALHCVAADADATLTGLSIGVVGVGAVGSRLVRRARGLGMKVLCSDPPREATESPGREFVSLDHLLEESDIVSLHVPLTFDGVHATEHLMGADAFARLKKSAWFLNTSRGAVVDERALLATLEANPDLRCVLDVWVGEPQPNDDLMRRVRYGTPHIAGYAMDGKVAGARTVAADLRAFLRAGEDAVSNTMSSALPRERLVHAGPIEEIVRRLYDFRGDVEAFDAVLAADVTERADVFRSLRREYPQRREFSAWDVVLPPSSTTDLRGLLEDGIGVRVVIDHGS